ncbi:MAG TPA: DUF4861 family protein [Terriglobales bacterium]|nr:DUF4861 family protein [Terriglobales bacterium]
MKTALGIWMLLVCHVSWAEDHTKVIKLAVSNPGAVARPAANVVVRVQDLRKVATDFNLGAFIVTVSDASTLIEDAKAPVATEVPSQADDLDGDDRADEIAFQIPLQPGQTRIVSIAYGNPYAFSLIKSAYSARAHTKFSRHYEGLGWESDLVGWRLYFDPRNAIDLFGKYRSGLVLDQFSTDGYDYHSEAKAGRDIYKIGNSLGIGSVGAQVNGKIVKVADVKARNWRIVADGPVRAIAEMTYTGWRVAGRTVDLTSKVTIWAGERGFEHEIVAKNADGLELVTGLPRKPEAQLTELKSQPSVRMLATWGTQVLRPGATATEALPGQNLGLLIALESERGGAADTTADDHLVPLKLQQGVARWYVAAAWDHENSEPILVTATKPADKYGNGTRVLPGMQIASLTAFQSYAEAVADVIAKPTKVDLLTSSAAVQSAPPDTLVPSEHKTWSQAINLMRTAVDRNAMKFEPTLSQTPFKQFGEGTGFFELGDGNTGEWAPTASKGLNWTAGFWTGELWKLYERTRDEKYRRWAEKWGAAFLGPELTEQHDVGFLNYYSSIFGYKITKNLKYREGGLKAAERLKQLYNPRTELVAAWEVGGDDSIIDTMMNIQLFWWAARETGDSSWRDLGLKHARKTARWMVRPDGSIVQSVHYNPTDRDIEIKDAIVNGKPLVVSPGQISFKHTHQGFSADTSWSRGTAWGLYGFSVAYEETKDPELRATAERIADFILSRLPEDGVPWYDFMDEGVHFRTRDTSAAALIAGGLLRLSRVEPDETRAVRYRKECERITQSIIDRYLTPVGSHDSTPPGVLRHGSAWRPNDGMLIYGDYYLLEALLELDSEQAKQQGASRK